MLERPAVLSSLHELSAIPVLEGLAKLHPAVFVLDPDGQMVWIKDAIGLLHGTETTRHDRMWREARPARTCFADPAQLDELQARFAREGVVRNAHVQLLGCHGARVAVEVDVVRLTLDGAHSLLVGTVRPVGDREEATAQSPHPAAFLAGLLDSTTTPVLGVDERGFVTFANPAVGQLLGYAPEELIQKPIGLLAASSERVAAAIASHQRGDHAGVELRHSDGSSRHVTLETNELRLADGSVHGSVVVVHDRSEEHLVREELHRKNAELEHYVQNVTHDLRSPLVSLLGFSRLLRQEYGDGMDETARHFLDRIEKAGHSMEALINDLLELSRIESSQRYDVRVNVNDVLKQLQAEFKPRLEGQGVRLVLPSEPVVVRCDRTRLYQVFSNLIGNALDYMGPVADPEIRIEVFEEPGEHRIVVRDNGRGIEPSQRERIFELFQSAGSRSDGRRGTGIGLAIVKKIAQSQGGRAWAESRPGQGAALHLTLPRD